MGNKDPRDIIRQQVQPYPNNESPNNGARQQRVGLTPTDGRDAYKRASTRSSRRSRAERTSYLVATGHLDIEETQHLNREPPNEFVGHPNLSNNVLPHQPPPTQTTTTVLRAGPSNGDQNFLDYPSSRQFHVDDQILAQKNVMFSKQPNANKSKNSSRGNSKSSGNNRNKFRQKSYTEVALPMKTSPAFEYILKDNKRRNRRCCLWLLYSTLMIVCIAIILFCSTHLALRYQSK